MVGVTAILVGYLAGQLLPDTFNGTINSPTLMIGFCVLFAFGVAYIAYRGVTGTTGVNVAINVIQISRPADLLGDRHRLPPEPPRRLGRLHARSRRQRRSKSCWPLDKDGKPIKDEKTGEYKVEQENGKDKPLMLDYAGNGDHAGAGRQGQARTARSKTPSSSTRRPPRSSRRTRSASRSSRPASPS